MGHERIPNCHRFARLDLVHLCGESSWRRGPRGTVASAGVAFAATEDFGRFDGLKVYFHRGLIKINQRECDKRGIPVSRKRLMAIPKHKLCLIILIWCYLTIWWIAPGASRHWISLATPMANWFFVWSPNIEIGVSDQQLGSPKKKGC